VRWFRRNRNAPRRRSHEAERVNRAVDALEGAIARGAYAGRLNAAQIVLGTALGLVGRDFQLEMAGETTGPLSLV